MRRCCILTCLVLIGCTPQGPSANGTDTNQQAISQLQSRVAALESRLQKLSSTVADHTNRINTINEQWTTAEFDPTDSTYQRIDSKPGIGSFAVSVEDVQSFGDGVRLRLNLGNPSSAVVSGVGLKLKYGPRVPDYSDPNFSDLYTAWTNSLQSKEEKLTADLRPGAWNPITVTLPKIDAKNFGYLEVGISNSSVSLARR
jgi:hypothetical protein